MFMLRHQALIPENVDQNDEKIPEDKIEYYMYASMWSMSTSLTVILLSNTILALLDKPLDPPKTLLVNNRYARLSGRLIYSMVILTVPATKHLSVDLYLGIASIMMSFLIAAEWIMSLERGGGLLEPRGLTAILSSRRRAHKHTSRDRSKHPVNAEGA